MLVLQEGQPRISTNEMFFACPMRGTARNVSIQNEFHGVLFIGYSLVICAHRFTIIENISMHALPKSLILSIDLTGRLLFRCSMADFDTEWQKCSNTERQKCRNTERQKCRNTERQKCINAESRKPVNDWVVSWLSEADINVGDMRV